MKTILKSFCLIAAVLLTVINSTAQKTKNIPPVVLSAFSAKYPQAQLKRWKTGHDNYMALFKLGDEKYGAYWSKDGIWLNTEEYIRRKSDLPAGIVSYLKKSTYASWNIDEMKKVLSPGQDTYLLHVDNHSGSPLRYEDAGSADDQLLSFDGSGKLIKVAENN